MVMLGGFVVFMFLFMMAVVGGLFLCFYRRSRKVEHLFLGLLSVAAGASGIYTLFIQ